jgi:hypothetical protein
LWPLKNLQHFGDTHTPPSVCAASVSITSRRCVAATTRLPGLLIFFPSPADFFELKDEQPMKTTKIGGKHLSASCFAYVGDVEDPRTWRVALRVPGDVALSVNHIKNAIQRFSETKGIPDHALSIVWNLIVGAAKGYGIDVDPRQPERANGTESVPSPAPENIVRTSDKIADKSEDRTDEAMLELAAERFFEKMTTELDECEEAQWRADTKQKLAELTR